MRVGVVFPGQGSQVVGMGGALLERYPSAADIFLRAERVLRYDVATVVRRGPEEKLRETRYSQPAIFVVNYALAVAAGEALAPVASAGHSFGEYCSLALAGALAFEDALRLVHQRALAMQEAADAEPGAMAAVLGLDARAVAELVNAVRAEGGRVTLANFNAPTQIVVSGEQTAVRDVGDRALGAGAKRVVPLNVSGAWHSELMAAARERFAPYVERANLRPPAFTVVSNVDALPYRDVATIRANLIRSLTDEVRWHAASERLLDERLDLVVEFGGSAVLTPLLRRLPGAPPSLHVGDENGVSQLGERLGRSVAVLGP